MANNTIEMRLIEKAGKTYTRVKIGKAVTSPIIDIINLYCASNPEKYKAVKSSSRFDYYEFEGDHLNFAGAMA